jgi:hypothetical protein
MAEKLLEVIFYAEASVFVLLPVPANVTIGIVPNPCARIFSPSN